MISTEGIKHRSNEENATRAARAMIDNLLEIGMLTKEQHREVYLTKQIIIRKPSAITRLWEKIMRVRTDDEFFLVATISNDLFDFDKMED